MSFFILVSTDMPYDGIRGDLWDSFGLYKPEFERLLHRQSSSLDSLQAGG